MGWEWDIIYYVFYVRVKLNSWRWTLKRFKKWDVYLNFLMLILTDVLLSFVLEFEW